ISGRLVSGCGLLPRLIVYILLFFFFQAEDGIRDRNVTGVQTCALPICRGGALQDLEPHHFGAAAIREAIQRANVEPGEIDDVIFGNVLAGGGNMARLTALEAGLPMGVPGLTIDRQCGSGMNAVALAAQVIRAGFGEIFIAGGTESMTRAPYLMQPPAKA